MNKLAQSLELALIGHNGDNRKGTDIPFVIHPIRCSEFVAEFCKKSSLTSDQILRARCVMLLHDTVEDTYITPELLIKSGLDDKIVDAVLYLTDDPVQKKKIGKFQYHVVKYARCQKEEYIFYKLIDRYDNLCDDPSKIQVIESQDLMLLIKQHVIEQNFNSAYKELILKLIEMTLDKIIELRGTLKC